MINANPAIAPVQQPSMHKVLKVVVWGSIVTTALWLELMIVGLSTLPALFAAWMMSGLTTIVVAWILASADGLSKNNTARVREPGSLSNTDAVMRNLRTIDGSPESFSSGS